MKTIALTILLSLVSSVSFAQWSEQFTGSTGIIYSVSSIDNSTVWACGAGGKVFRTTNGGSNWQDEMTKPATIDLYNIWGINTTTAIVTGSNTTATFVYKTTNSTQSWTQVFTQTGGFIDAIGGLSSVNPDALFMYGDPVGGRWSLWQSTNAGATWDSAGWYLPQAGSETGYNNSMHILRTPFSSLTEIWFGTNNTRIYKWSLAQVWTTQATTGQVNSLAIVMRDNIYGFDGGSTGMLVTTNGGINWNNASIAGSGSVNGFAYGYDTTEFFYSRGSSIYQTTNNGTNWIIGTTQPGTYNHLQGARTDYNYNIWAVRSNGGISKYSYPIGIKPISNEIPKDFILHQNYPNPFNPSTKIRFELPKSEFITMKIFDALGREVTTLVNEQLKPGTYEAEFNGINYPSGVYFYKLIAGDYTDTKRMVLVK